MVILMAIAVARGHRTKPLGRPADIIGEYVDYLCNSLVGRGYLKGDNLKGYRLTAKGQEALLEFLGANKTNIEDAVETLQVLGIEISEEIDILRKKAIEVRR
jgi:predicted transcriptional regulator